MDLKQFDIVLDPTDENFVADLRKALGLKPGEAVNFITPQFTRTDGRCVTYCPTTPEEYAALPKMAPENLTKIGCQKWDEANGRTHWLYPHEWYDHIPAGTEIVDIFDNVENFEPGITDNDMRFGALSFGFYQQKH
jgi:hypothetical protein